MEKLEGGEVSGFLHDDVIIGDELEVRGPIGHWFIWEGRTPAVLVGGGSGVVPLMAMLRLARKSGRSNLVRLAVWSAHRRTCTTPMSFPGPKQRSSIPAERHHPAHGRPAGSPSTICLRWSCLMRPPLCAVRPALPILPVSSWCVWANRWSGSESSDSVLPVSFERPPPGICESPAGLADRGTCCPLDLPSCRSSRW